MNDLKLFTGRANPKLARDICDYLGLPLGKISVGDFPDGENYCKIEEDIRGRHVYLIQQFLEDSGDYIVESPLDYLRAEETQ